ncbi:hypothetical protein [Paracidovorax wautersii]|uniref:Uncharacterized protein n=1 Tax=Paracidovorax wautersii TaxID=1177982 RepID=A0ABU1IB24_9BURK|nr:hypothetical protein [Paracidovorax wautersii]MDR6214426.1 hypothetical protein [Paracidovorax wautersii]
MVTQLDSPDGRPRNDPDRPSPDLVETDTASKEKLPGYGQDAGRRPAPAYTPEEAPPERGSDKPDAAI